VKRGEQRRHGDRLVDAREQPVEKVLVQVDRLRLLGFKADAVLIDNGLVKNGDLIVLTIGEPIGKAGGTNTMKIVKIGDSGKA